jgi:alkylated DNA repair protein alkB family protein 4
MNTDRPCGCKSFRSCFVCEETSGIKSIDISEKKFDECSEAIWIYCPKCTKVFKNTKTLKDCEDHTDEVGECFSGIRIIPEFVTLEEEERLIQGLDLLPWDQSQSGRRKQNFGPRANFKKRKTKVGNFVGFPKCTQFIQERFDNFPEILDGYRTVEQVPKSLI